jgi:hypothetical protein
MWRYTTFPSKAAPVIHYPSKDGHVISGSFPATNTKALIKFFAHFEKPVGDGLVHFTLSLPAGRQLSENDWHEITLYVLEESGLPPAMVPWVVWGGEKTNCDHVHIIAAQQTFTGRSLEVATSVAFTQKLARDLCHRLNLPEPDWLPDPGMCLVMPIPKRRQATNAAAFHFASELNAVMSLFRPETLPMLNDGLRQIKSLWQIGVSAQNANYLIPENTETGCKINPRDAGPAFSSKNILRRLAFATRLRLARTALFLRRFSQHIGSEALPVFSTTQGHQNDRIKFEPQNYARKVGSDTGGHPEVAPHPDASRLGRTGPGYRLRRPPVQYPAQPGREDGATRASHVATERSGSRGAVLPQPTYRSSKQGRGIWLFRLLKLARDSGLSAQHCFIWNDTAILLHDDEGCQGIFDMVDETIQAAGATWDERWQNLSSCFKEQFDWQMSSKEPEAEPSTEQQIETEN